MYQQFNISIPNKKNSPNPNRGLLEQLRARLGVNDSDTHPVCMYSLDPESWSETSVAFWPRSCMHIKVINLSECFYVINDNIVLQIDERQAIAVNKSDSKVKLDFCNPVSSPV